MGVFYVFWIVQMVPNRAKHHIYEYLGIVSKFQTISYFQVSNNKGI